MNEDMMDRFSGMETPSTKSVWLLDGEEKRSAVRKLFDDIAPTYDRVNSLLSLRLHQRWRATAVRELKLQGTERALDLCCGTGDFVAHFRKVIDSRGLVLGLDFSSKMLEKACEKVSGKFGLGDACRIPLQSQSVDVVSVGWGIRNLSDIDLAHREIFRVLRPGGRFVSLDMAQPKDPVLRKICGAFSRHVFPKVGALFGNAPAYRYLPESSLRFLSREELCASMRTAGFEEVRTRDFLLGNICMHLGVRP